MAEQELASLRIQVERLKCEKAELEDQLGDVNQANSNLEATVTKLEENARWEAEKVESERAKNKNLIKELSAEVCM